jgi:hypothetical protein
MRHGRAVQILWGACVLALAGWACESAQNPGGFQQDLVPPTVDVSTSPPKVAPAVDTQVIANGLKFTVTATDNLALNDIRLTYTGGYVATSDTIFTNQTLTKVTLPVTVTFPASSGAGGLIRVVGRATDGKGNFKEDTLFIFLSNVQALKVFLIAPGTGALASTGKTIPVEVTATQLAGIRKVGFLIAPPAATTNPTIPPNDSITYTIPYKDSVDYVDTLNVVALTGTFTITGFAEDSSGRRSTSNTVTVTVQSAANDTTPPSVTDSVGIRVEVSDTVMVHATDPSGISVIGFRVRRASDSSLIRFDSVLVGGSLTDIVRRFSLNIAALIATFPATVLVDGYACDAAAARNCARSTLNGVVRGTLKADSAQVVAGVSRALPAGGKIADAIFNARRGELYLTNAPLSRVEVFQVANTSFVAAGIPTAGPTPWGLALWPRDTMGVYGDSIVVADAGGTEMSIIDVAARRLRWRQDLPNFQIEKYQVTNVGGFYYAHITLYDLSDRPQYIGTMCRVGAAPPNCDADSIFVLYATTPTQSSSTPFGGKGTLRMEKLINTNALTFPADTGRLFGHFFWEIGGQGASDATDTLRIELRRGLPYNQTQVILSACRGVTINFATFGLGDSTFARNSGNFTHGFVGEGGNADATYRRVIAYTTKALLAHGAGGSSSPNTFLGPCFTSPDTTASGPTDQGYNDEDYGVSPAVDVRDFISNTGVHVSSIATNFNGGTNLVRADSIYYLDEGLRLKGTSPAPAGAFGMDMNYNHDFLAGQGGTPGTYSGVRDSTNRVVFAADASGNILVFDTFFYGQLQPIGSIPVRDPIIGPLRVAKDALGNQLLFGITARGLVMVKLPAFPNTNPAPPRLHPAGRRP